MKPLACLAAALGAAALCAPASASATANLLTNGGFETGDFTGWTEVDDSNSTFVQLGDFDGASPSQGQYQAVLGASNTGELSQEFAAPVGHSYRLSFDLANDLAGANVLTFSLGAQHTIVCLHCDAFDYQHDSYEFQSVSPVETLAFDFFNASSDFRLDNVSVLSLDAVSSAAPEPAGWGLMILGFAAAGGAVRAARRHRQLAGA